MVVNLSLVEANMLLAAASRMECDDIWDSELEGGMYTEKQAAALETAARKLGQVIAYAESKKAKAKPAQPQEDRP